MRAVCVCSCSCVCDQVSVKRGSRALWLFLLAGCVYGQQESCGVQMLL